LSQTRSVHYCVAYFKLTLQQHQEKPLSFFSRSALVLLQRKSAAILILPLFLYGSANHAAASKKPKPVAAKSSPVPVITGDARVDKLLSELTLDEKISLIHGATEDPSVYQGQAGYLPGVKRLGIPSLRFADGPPGVLTRHPSQAETATMGVAATFSVKDAEQNGVVIGREARSLGIDVALQPFINIDRDITFARGYNTFGEDPVLTGAMGAAEIRGIQSQDVMAQAKHFVAYDTDSFNVYVDPQTLHEVYVAPFVDAVDAGVSSVMCSYNRVNGMFACGNDDVLNKILKDELGFKGFVTSDWGAVHSVSFINSGLDMEMPGPAAPDSPFAAMMHSYFDLLPRPSGPPPKPNAGALAGMLGGQLPEEPPSAFDLGTFPRDAGPEKMSDALKNGSITEETITRAAGRVLFEMDKFGYLDGKQKHTITEHATSANAAVIEKTAEDAAVLLKNDGNALPLKNDDLQSLALIGPGAGQVVSIGISGERSVGLPERQIGPLEALKRGALDAKITYAVDDDMTGTPIPAEALSHNGEPGLERISAGKSEVDEELNFTKSNGKTLPANGISSWKGTLTVSSSGSYWLYLQALGAYASLEVDGRLVGRTGATKGAVHGDIQQAGQDNVLPATDGLDNVRRAIELTAGPHEIEVSITGDTSNDPEQIRLNWVTPEQREANHAAAIAAAKGAKTAVVFLWTRGRPAFHLPGDQDQLVDQIAAVNPNTIVVLNVSQPVAMPWLSKVKAVLQMWWPGDEGGWATANLLLGKADPAGRLPFTWGQRLEDYPATDPQHPERSAKGVDGKTTYSEGLDIGYRWFDQQKIAPLFPFGFGMSYTDFEYSGLKIVKVSDGGFDVHFSIKNTGAVAGDEVPQVYLSAPDQKPDGVQFAPRTLAAFDRVSIPAGESRDVTLHLPLRRFQYWSAAESRWMTAPGPRTLYVAASSRDLRLQDTVNAE
jgi:beta-glucosidase